MALLCELNVMKSLYRVIICFTVTIKTKLKTFVLLLNEGCCYEAIQLLRRAVCSVGFLGESVTKVYGSTLLALRVGKLVSNFLKKT